MVTLYTLLCRHVVCENQGAFCPKVSPSIQFFHSKVKGRCECISYTCSITSYLDESIYLLRFADKRGLDRGAGMLYTM